MPTLPAGCGQVEAVPPDVVCTADEVPVIAAAVLAIVVVEPRVWRVYGVFMVMVILLIGESGCSRSSVEEHTLPCAQTGGRGCINNYAAMTSDERNSFGLLMYANHICDQLVF